MAFKANGVVIVSDTRDLTITTDTTMTRDTGNVAVTSTGLVGSGYSISGNKVFTSAGSAFANAVFDQSASLNFQVPFTPQQGSISGYASGGRDPNFVDTIDKFPFSSDTPATDVGEMTLSRSLSAGSSSDVSGYNSGGTFPPQPPFKNTDTIDKFPFSSDTPATDVGELFQSRWQLVGQSSSTDGYSSGGFIGTNPDVNTIDKFPFSSDTSGTDVGELSQTRRVAAGQSSLENGYTTGGNIPAGPGINAGDTIDKFPFAADAPATDVGELSQARQGSTGQSSDVNGYTSGGGLSSPPGTPPPVTNTVDKFPFAADASATDVGELSQARTSMAGSSSQVNGYTSGGSPPELDTIDKFPFASDSNATDVGELTESRSSVTAGQQSGGNA